MDNKSSTLTVAKSSNGHNASQDPAKLRAEIAQTRDEMSGTIEQLHGRLNPVVFKDQALEQFHEAAETVKQELKAHFQDAKDALMAEFKEAKETVRDDVLDEIDTVKSKVNEEIVQAKAAVRRATIGKVENMMRRTKDAVTDNPIPSALAAVGLSWLFIAARRKRASRLRESAWSESQVRSVRDLEPERFELATTAEIIEPAQEPSMGDRIRDVGQQTGRQVADTTKAAASAVGHAAHQAMDSVSDVAQKAGHSVSNVAQKAGHTASDVAHWAGHTASAASHGAGRQARRIEKGSIDLFRANPIAVGAALLAAGTIVGLAVPRTRAEDRWMGGTRDDVVGKAQGLAHQAFDKADEAVKHTGDTEETQSEPSTRQFDPYH